MPTTLAALTLHQRQILLMLASTKVAYALDTLALRTKLSEQEVDYALTGLRQKCLARQEETPHHTRKFFRATKTGRADAMAYRNTRGWR